MSKKTNSKLTSIDNLIQKEYGKIGSTNRDEFEEGFEAFKIGVMKNFDDLIEFEHGKIGSESRMEYEKNAHLFINNEMLNDSELTKNQSIKLTRNILVMNKIEQLNNSKIPIIVFDKKLEQFRNKVLFPEKLAKANEILSRVGLPKKELK